MTSLNKLINLVINRERETPVSIKMNAPRGVAKPDVTIESLEGGGALVSFWSSVGMGAVYVFYERTKQFVGWQGKIK